MPRPEGPPMRWRETTEKADPNVRIFRAFVAVPEGEHEMLRVTYLRA